MDASGNAYVTGETASSNFGTTDGAFQRSFGGYVDAFVAKLNPAGSTLSYSTYLGGSGRDEPRGIAVDASGSAYVTGATSETSLVRFPTTSGAAQTAPGGTSDVFVTKSNAAGSALSYSTYLGRSDSESGTAIAVNAAGNAFITGSTGSADFPTTNGAAQTTSGGASDAFMAKLNPAGSALSYATYLGGSSTDTGSGIAVDGSGNAYVTGDTYSTDFPTTSGVVRTIGGHIRTGFTAKVPTQTGSEAGTAGAHYTSLSPSRVLDTRDGTGRGGTRAKVGPASSITLDVTGPGGVPASGVSAVVVNVTATERPHRAS